MSEVVIKIEDLHKKYRLGAIGGGTLTADLQSWWAKVRGKEDPNSKIGAKTYGKNETFMAINGINLEVKKGETLGIIGGNGAGKSTTLKILSRVTAPTKGSVKIKGRISSLLEVGTGFHPELTGRENIYLNGAILGMSKEEVDSKIEDIIEFSECRQFIDTPVKRYSSGMFVKLAFSVAAHLDSEILIMDEVLAVGDMKFQKKCIDKMKNIAKEEGRTILYVSHNMSTIKQLCNRIIVLDKGKVKYEGAVEEGIEIYLNNTNQQYSTFNDYRNLERPDFISKDAKLRMLSMEILNKEKNIFSKDRLFRSILKWENYEDINDVQIRYEIKSFDNEPIATSFSKQTIRCKKGSICEYKINLDISMLSPGKYKLFIVISELDTLGKCLDLDTVQPSCLFEVREDENTNYILDWRNSYWGNVRFTDIELIDLNNINESNII